MDHIWHQPPGELTPSELTAEEMRYLSANIIQGLHHLELMVEAVLDHIKRSDNSCPAACIGTVAGNYIQHLSDHRQDEDIVAAKLSLFLALAIRLLAENRLMAEEKREGEPDVDKA